MESSGYALPLGETGLELLFFLSLLLFGQKGCPFTGSVSGTASHDFSELFLFVFPFFSHCLSLPVPCLFSPLLNIRDIGTSSGEPHCSLTSPAVPQAGGLQQCTCTYTRLHFWALSWWDGAPAGPSEHWSEVASPIGANWGSRDHAGYRAAVRRKSPTSLAFFPCGSRSRDDRHHLESPVFPHAFCLEQPSADGVPGRGQSAHG